MPLLKTNIFFFIFLAMITIFSHRGVDRYQQIGPELLTDNWIANVSGNGRVDSIKNQWTLFSSDPQVGASIHQDIPFVAPGTVLLLSAEVKSDHVVPGKNPWNLARLILVQNDGTRDLWDLPLIVAYLTGTHDWENYRNFFYITPETQSIRVIAELKRTTGTLQIRNPQLYPVSETERYLWTRDIILFSWGAFFLSLIGSCLFISRKTLIFRALLVSAFIAIIIGTALPGDIKDQILDEIETQIHADNQSFKAIIPWDLSKVGHFCFFFFLGSILCLMLAKKPIVHVMTIILMLAGGTEFAQIYIDGRTPLVADFLIDAVGGLSGIIVTRLFGKNKTIGPLERGNSFNRQ